MQVILLERVAKLGQMGDVVNVKSGYGRNFLLPQGKATLATPDNVTKFEARRAELEKLAKEQLADYHFLTATNSSGRRTLLDCGQLMVEFGAASESRPDRPGSLGAFSLRDVRQLEATEGVLLVDDDNESLWFVGKVIRCEACSC